MGRMEEIFENKETMDSFKTEYYEAIKESIRPESIDLLNWDVVANEVVNTLYNKGLEVGELLAIELDSYHSKTKNPVMIHVGELIQIPEFDDYGNYVSGTYVFE